MGGYVGGKPTEHPVPCSHRSRRLQLPPELIERPVGLCAVPKHGRGDPVMFGVRSPSSDWNDMINCWRQVPVSDMGVAHFPIPVIGKELRKSQ